MIALAVGTLLALAALAFVLYPLFSDPRAARAVEPGVSAEVERGQAAIAALREVEFDRATGSSRTATTPPSAPRIRATHWPPCARRAPPSGRCGGSGGSRHPPVPGAPSRVHELRSAPRGRRALLLVLRTVPSGRVRRVRHSGRRDGRAVLQELRSGIGSVAPNAYFSTSIPNVPISRNSSAWRLKPPITKRRCAASAGNCPKVGSVATQSPR